MTKPVKLLTATLEEEKATDQKLTELAETAVNAEAGPPGKSNISFMDEGRPPGTAVPLHFIF